MLEGTTCWASLYGIISAVSGRLSRVGREEVTCNDRTRTGILWQPNHNRYLINDLRAMASAECIAVFLFCSFLSRCLLATNMDTIPACFPNLIPAAWRSSLLPRPVFLLVYVVAPVLPAPESIIFRVTPHTCMAASSSTSVSETRPTTTTSSIGPAHPYLPPLSPTTTAPVTTTTTPMMTSSRDPRAPRFLLPPRASRERTPQLSSRNVPWR